MALFKFRIKCSDGRDFYTYPSADSSRQAKKMAEEYLKTMPRRRGCTMKMERM